MEKIYIILRNGKLYHGLKHKSKTIKAYTERGTAEGVIKRESKQIAKDMFRHYYYKNNRYADEDMYDKFLKETLKEFSIKEVEI